MHSWRSKPGSNARSPAPTATKTIQTLHDNLRRQPIKLSRLQDIAGVRIVQDMDLHEQDSIVRISQASFRAPA